MVVVVVVVLCSGKRVSVGWFLMCMLICILSGMRWLV